MDDRCWRLIGHIWKAGNDWLTVRELFAICNSREAKRDGTTMAYGTIRKCLKQLAEEGIIEYKNQYQRGSKHPFRLSPTRYRDNLALLWVQKMHAFVQEALLYLGNHSVEQELSKYDLSSDPSLAKPQHGIEGKLLLQYGSKAYPATRDFALRARYIQPMLLSINWSYVGPKEVNLAVNVHPGQVMPQITFDLTRSRPTQKDANSVERPQDPR